MPQLILPDSSRQPIRRSIVPKRPVATAWKRRPLQPKALRSDGRTTYQFINDLPRKLDFERGPTFLAVRKFRENRMTEIKIHEHHEQAAQHYEHAAKHHREAAKLHQAGSHEKAAHHARIAFGHYLEAADHQNHAARQHAKMHS